MSLPTVDDLATYLRIDDLDKAAELSTLTSVLLAAKATLQSLITVPIAATPIVYVDKSNDGVQFSVPRVLMFPYRPITGTVTVKDADGVIVDISEYRVDAQSGFIYARNLAPGFPNGPYELTGTYGLELGNNYATMVEPMLSQCVIDIAADFFQRRSPDASAVEAGNTRTNYDASAEVIARVMSAIKILKLPVTAV